MVLEFEEVFRLLAMPKSSRRSPAHTLPTLNYALPCLLVLVLIRQSPHLLARVSLARIVRSANLKAKRASLSCRPIANPRVLSRWLLGLVSSLIAFCPSCPPPGLPRC